MSATTNRQVQISDEHQIARAKIATITTRSSPSVPAPSQAYDPFVKSVLSHRLLTKIFPYSAAFSLIATGVWRTLYEGGGVWTFILNLALFRPKTLLYAFFLWLFGILPVLLMRKNYLKVPSRHASSPVKVLKSAILTKPHLRGGLYIYILSSLAFAMFYVLSFNAPSQDGLRLFVKSKKHPYYLDGRLVFIITSQIVHAAIFFLRNVMLDRFFISWVAAGKKTSLSSFTKAIISVMTVILVGVLCSSIHLVLFAFCRSIQLPMLFKIPLVSYVLRPFAGHFLKGPWSAILFTKQIALILKTFSLGMFTVGSWEFSETMFDLFVAKPVFITPSAAEPFAALISGITSSDQHFRYFAYLELKDLAAEQSAAASARRAAFFADQKFSPTLWSHLCREALLLLGQDYQCFLAKGKAGAPAPLPPASVTPALNSVKPPSTPLNRKQIFKTNQESPVQSVLDSLSSDGKITQTVDAGASHVPELFRSIGVASPVHAGVVGVKEVEKTAVSWAKALRARVMDTSRKYMHRSSLQVIEGFESWWIRDRIDKNVRAYMWNKETDVLIVQALSLLTCASFTEDRYGVVQRDIPKILEALLSFLAAIEDRMSELSALDTLASSTPEDISKLPPRDLSERERIREEVINATEMMGSMEDALKEGMIRIVMTFGDTLSAFKFPPRVARSLQGYVDYN